MNFLANIRNKCFTNTSLVTLISGTRAVGIYCKYLSLGNKLKLVLYSIISVLVLPALDISKILKFWG